MSGDQRHGRIWERLIEREVRALDRDNRLRAMKVPLNIEGVVVKAGRAAGRLGAASWPDFTGHLVPGARAVCWDAKATLKDRWSLTELQDHQLARLTQHAADGALAFVYLAHMADDVTVLSRYVLPVTPRGIEGVQLGKTLRFDGDEAARYRVASLSAYLEGVIGG